MIIPTAEPFLLPGEPGRPGVLLIHGFTGTPKEMRGMGEYLHRERGLTCLGVRLSGHATQPEDMIRSRYRDWQASAEDGFHLLSHLTAGIFLAGLSMGGALALTLAARLPVQAVVAMSTPYELRGDWRLSAIRLIATIHAQVAKRNGSPHEGWFDHEAWRQHVSYSRNPTRAIGELNHLLAEMRAILPQVKVPVLLMHSRDDQYVPPNSMPSIYDRLGSPDKRMLWIEGSGHVITEDARRETVFKAAADFFAAIEPASPVLHDYRLPLADH
jgi:carboxylesterase